MLGMIKRHEVEILLKAGHSKAEVTVRKFSAERWRKESKTRCLVPLM
jgi:hypothetical protein